MRPSNLCHKMSRMALLSVLMFGAKVGLRDVRYSLLTVELRKSICFGNSLRNGQFMLSGLKMKLLVSYVVVPSQWFRARDVMYMYRAKIVNLYKVDTYLGQLIICHLPLSFLPIHCTRFHFTQVILLHTIYQKTP